MDLVVEVYKSTQEFPKEEQYGLVSQMRRCVVSVPSNIAEGNRRKGEKDRKHFLTIAFASGAELETQIEIAKRLGCGSDNTEVDTLLEEIMKMLNVMIYK